VDLFLDLLYVSSYLLPRVMADNQWLSSSSWVLSSVYTSVSKATTSNPDRFVPPEYCSAHNSLLSKLCLCTVKIPALDGVVHVAAQSMI
jgi:hypothetical protein